MNRKARKAHCPRADFDNMHDTRFRTYRLFANLPKLRQSPKTSEISENYARAQKKSPGEPGLESRAPADYGLVGVDQREGQQRLPMPAVHPLPVLERHVEVVGPVAVQGERYLVP